MDVTPFKNDTEAYHSIAVASVLYLQQNPNEILDYISKEIPEKYDFLTDELITYIKKLSSDKKLSLKELLKTMLD